MARTIGRVIVATDDERIFNEARGFGAEVAMTNPYHASGTDRVAEVAEKFPCDIIVNVQGDEPMIRPEMIDDVVGLLSDERVSIGTLAKKIDRIGDIADPNIVKVVWDGNDFAMYFSRSPIPYHRDEWKHKGNGQRARFTLSLTLPPRGGGQGWGGDPELQTFYCYKHIGIYSYRRDVLLRLSGIKPTRLEMTEKLEQLRALEMGYKIKVRETPFDTIGVDTPEDLKRVERLIEHG